MRKNTLILFVFILLKFVLQYLLINPAYELQRDEYLHLDQGRHLAWGYISVPPATSWISYLINALGNGVFWVKFFPALFGALTIVVVWKLIEELKGDLFACVLGALAMLTSALLRINLLYQPNSLDIFFWTLTYYALIKYFHSQKAKWLYITGLSLAFGFLSKYNIAFLAAGLLPAVLLTRHRKLFLDKHFYFALLLAFVLVLPNLFWQYQNDFPTFSQLKELSDTQLVNVNRLDFVKDQFLFFLPCIFVVFAAFISLLFYAPFTKYRFVLVSYAVTLCLFLFFKAKSYYALGLYPVLIAFGAVYLEKLFSNGWRYYLRFAAVVFIALLFIPFVLLAFPLFNPAYFAKHQERYQKLGLLRWEDGKDHQLPQDFADMLGWKELAQKTDSVYRRIAEKDATLVLCDNYGQAGAINYYSSFKGINAVSLNADYINWIPLQRPIKQVILVKDVYDSDSARENEKPFFQSITLEGSINNPYAREEGTRIYFLQGAKADINAILRKEIAARKKR